MKLYLALVLVSLSVLTAAKRPFIRRHKENHRSHHQKDQPAISTPCSYSHSGPVTYPGASTNVGTPTSSVTPSVAPTTYSTGWVQNPKGNASFTAYSGCQSASCGQRVSGYSAAVNELAFGANEAAGGACGRCFRITPNYDPYTPSYAGPFGNSIVVKVNDLCPASNNNQWCGQRVSKPLNSYGVPMHFDLCTDSGAPTAFFPGERRAMLGTFEEVSCREWPGTDGQKLWDGSCLAGESAGFWPDQGCPNKGTPP